MTRNALLTAVAVAVIGAPGLAIAQSSAPTSSAPTSSAPTSSAPTSSASAPAAVAAAPQVKVNGDLVDTLKLSGQFLTFTKGIDATNLAGLLKANKNLTVFAPTDAAFAAMPAADLAKLMTDKAAMQRFILHHIVNAPIPAAKIKGVKGPIPTGAGDTILLDGSDDAGTLRVDGATIIQADVQTASGLLQVVDRVLIAGQGAVEPATPAPATPAPATTGN